MKLHDHKHFAAIALIWAYALFSGFVLAKQPPASPIGAQPGLLPLESRFFDEFSLAPSTSLSSYRKVFIEQPAVSFDKRWLRDHRQKVSKRYTELTTQRYARILREQIAKAVAKHGHFQVVDEKSRDTLVIRASITDLDIHGPDSHIQRKYYVREAGDATLNVDIVSGDGETLAKFRDHRKTRDRGFDRLERTSRVENQRDFRMLMGKWSRRMVEHIAMY